MFIKSILGNLFNADSEKRLLAARHLAENPAPENIKTLERALKEENVQWVKHAIELAIRNTMPANKVEEVSALGDTPDSELYARALRDVSGQLIHELEPHLGMLYSSIAREVEDYQDSDTFKHISSLSQLLKAFRQLYQASKAPVAEQFDLGLVVSECEQEESLEGGPVLQLAGPQPLLVSGDRTLTKLILKNALRNAFEATTDAGRQEQSPVIATWGTTNLDYWCTILDEGVGLAGDTSSAYNIGATSKGGHSGMGLAICKQAALSLGATTSLDPRTQVGTRFELRVPLEQEKAL